MCCSSESAEQPACDGHWRNERGAALEQAGARRREHRQLRAVLERHLRRGRCISLASPRLITLARVQRIVGRTRDKTQGSICHAKCTQFL
jgi:hypothetical protein